MHFTGTTVRGSWSRTGMESALVSQTLLNRQNGPGRLTGKPLKFPHQQVKGPGFFAEARGFSPIFTPGLVGISLRTIGQHLGDQCVVKKVYWDGRKLIKNLKGEA